MNEPYDSVPPPPAAPDKASAPETTPDAGAKPAPGDAPPPKALLDFMVQEWSPRSDKLPLPIEHYEAFHQRRRALSRLFPGEALVIPTGHEKVRANDTHYAFRPGSDFYYLTGCLEPDCVLVMRPLPGGGHRDVLFVEPNPGRSDATFFTDRTKGELWVGPRLGVPQSRARFSVDECLPLGELPRVLKELAEADGSAFRVLRGFSASVDDALIKLDKNVDKDKDQDRDRDRDKKLAVELGEMRLIKDPIEVEELKAAVDATKRGFEDVIKRLPKAKTEREVEGIFNLRARIEGNDTGYRTIAASGPHACIMHFMHNDGRLDPRTLLLLDAGVELNSLYTADITRTLPISGRFTKEQRAIYKLVYKAQKAAFKQVIPGNDFMEPNRAAMRVLAEGLAELGILRVSAAEALKEEHQFYKRYSLHNISHMLGLDVHDCAEARKEVYKYGKLRPGMVLTIEPGLYFQQDDLTVPEKYRGIGVRIEDDVLVTETGFTNLSAHIPSQVDDVEAWMARIWKGRKKK